MAIRLIAAMDVNRAIGADNRLPWKLPEDMARFVRLTTGHTVLMGRKTFESIGKPLKNRLNLVLTRNPEYAPEGTVIVRSVEEAVHHYTDGELFVIGGADIYRQFLPYADYMHLTHIDHEFAGDAFFPEFDLSEWEIIEDREGVRDERNPYRYRFVTYRRKKS
jgi:dihydrofolate reductase